MANAEHLLHEAHFAFHNISFGESPGNKRNAARARSLCLKILRKFPATMEAQEAHAILMRLGDEAFSSKINVQHQHQTQAEHHRKPSPADKSPANQGLYIPPAAGDSETLNWGGLIAAIFALPKVIFVAIAFGAIFLFGLFGPFLFVPLLAFVLFTGPFRQMLKPEQREQMNAFIARVNEFTEKQR